MDTLSLAIARTAADARSLEIQAAIVAEKYLLETEPLSSAEVADIRTARNRARVAVEVLDLALGEHGVMATLGAGR